MLKIIHKHYNVIVELNKACNGIKLDTLIVYRSIYLTYNSYIEQGAKEADAVTWTSEDISTSEATVYRALRFFAEK